MANLQDRQITAAGQTYTIRFGLKAILALQDEWGLEDEKAVEARLGAATNRDFPTILWAALRTHHPELTPDAVLGWLDDAGIDGMQQVAEQLESAVEVAQPKARPPGGQRTRAPATR
jgi:hypothetical protein